MKKILEAFAANTVFANICLLMILVGGALALSSMLRESFPQFSTDKISIQVLYPGADPEEVEEGVILKLEEALTGIEGIKQYTTVASENVGSAVVDVLEGSDIKKVLDDIKSQVDAISTFPADAEKPVVKEILMRDSVALVALSGALSEKQLKAFAEQVRDEIRLLDGISQVELFGVRREELAVEVSEEQLRHYNIRLEQIAEAIRRSSLNMPGGLLRTQGEEIRLRTLGRQYTAEDLADIVVLARPSGELIRLGMLAQIRDAFVEDPPIRSEVDGLPTAFVMVFKTSKEDSVHISNTVKEYIETKQQQLPPDISITEFYDNSSALRARIALLTKNGLVGLFLVFFLLWLFLDLRLSFWAGMGIPISLAGAMFILWYLGATLNMISLFGFIMVLGIVVDDAIVVGESIYVHRQMGKPPLVAAVDGVTEVSMPIFAAVTTTIVAFIPLAFIGGVMGKFIAIMPVVVISCLIISLWESLFLLPAHLSHLPDLRGPRPPSSNPLHLLQRFSQRSLAFLIDRIYIPFLAWTLQWRYLFLAFSISSLLVAGGLVQGGIVKFQVFPKLDSFVITSNVEFPDGTPASVTQEALFTIERAFMELAAQTETVSGEDLIERRLILVGQTMGQQGKTGANVGSVQFILLPSEKRGVHSNELLIAWEKKVGNLSGVRSLTFEGLSAGPGGAEIELWLQGERMADLLAAAETVKEQLHSFTGVLQIRSDFSPGKNEFRLQLKPEARTLGLSVDELARQVQAGFYGVEPLRIQRGQEDIRVKVRYPLTERSQVASLEQMRILAPNGQALPLLAVAEVDFGPGFSSITRTDGKRRVVVTADVDPKLANAQEIFNQLSEGGFFAELEAAFPGLSISMQGAKKNMQESFASLKLGFPLAVLGIFVIVATIFRSYLQPLIILVSIPFGVIGAILGHLLMGYDMSMMSMFGIVALTGVVVNGAIVLIERVNENLAEGMSFFNAVVKGSARRFRAILLTSLSTVGGLAPLILETDMQARFLIPMALSLAGGVLCATILTLILIPNLITILNDGRRLLGRIKTGIWLEREALEPAARRRLNRMEWD
jgi:multidrug efflux pump subunit AcrB